MKDAKHYDPVYESVRYIVEGASPLLPAYKDIRQYSVTNKGVYVRATLISPEGRHYKYPWTHTTIDPTTLDGKVIKRRKPKLMGGL